MNAEFKRNKHTAKRNKTDIFQSHLLNVMLLYITLNVTPFIRLLCDSIQSNTYGFMWYHPLIFIKKLIPADNEPVLSNIYKSKSSVWEKIICTFIDINKFIVTINVLLETISYFKHFCIELANWLQSNEPNLDAVENMCYLCDIQYLMNTCRAISLMIILSIPFQLNLDIMVRVFHS